MSVEADTGYIDGLEAAWPTSQDPVSEGDDHFQLLKTVLKTTFPGAGGDGFAAPITASESELNYMVGVTSGVQGQLDALESDINTLESDVTTLQSTLSAPSGTRMLFQQTTAPTGWVKDTTNTNDRALRIVSGAAGSGGSRTFSSTFSQVATGSTILSASQSGVGAHKHIQGAAIRQSGGNHIYGSVSAGARLEATSSVVSITDHPFTQTVSAAASSGHTHTMDMRLLYLDVILAQKS